MSDMKIRKYNQRHPAPRGKGIFFRCLICGETLPSDTEHSLWCKCHNLSIDVDAGRLGIRDASKVVIVEDTNVRDDVEPSDNE
jgi:ribosomal protein S26